jgi:hypothetical protein
MAMTLADLRAQRASTDYSAITAAMTKKNDYADKDEGFWKPTRDKAGNASAVIRFLPKHPDDKLPWSSIYSHSFKNASGKWFIDNCPTTLGNECPVCALNRESWATQLPDEKKKAGDRKRKLSYIANILVVSDPANPDNNGKVFRFKFGKKIFEKIMDKVQPTFADEKPVKIFDPWEGANFKLRMTEVEGYPSYEKSVFDAPAPISDDDEEILRVVNQQISVDSFIDPKHFKSFEDLKKRLDSTINGTPASTAKAEEVVREMQEQLRSETKAAAPVKAKEAPEPKTTVKASPAADPGDDDLEEYFRNLAD